MRAIPRGTRTGRPSKAAVATTSTEPDTRPAGRPSEIKVTLPGYSAADRHPRQTVVTLTTAIVRTGAKRVVTGNSHVAGLAHCCPCACLYRVAVPGGELRRP